MKEEACLYVHAAVGIQSSVQSSVLCSGVVVGGRGGEAGMIEVEGRGEATGNG